MAGWRTVFLGPAVPVETVLETARREKAELVGVSYRLTPETGERLLASFAEEADDLRSGGVRFAFGGTPPVAARARALGFFERVFEGGESPETVLAYLHGQVEAARGAADFPQRTVERIAWKAPFPLIRHHFGLPTLEATRRGIAAIADGLTRTHRRIFFTLSVRTGAGRERGVCLYAVRRITAVFMPSAAQETILCCAHTRAQMISFDWQRCTRKQSISPGARFPYSGSIKWMDAAHGTWRARSVNTRR